MVKHDFELRSTCPHPLGTHCSNICWECWTASTASLHLRLPSCPLGTFWEFCKLMPSGRSYPMMAGNWKVNTPASLPPTWDNRGVFYNAPHKSPERLSSVVLIRSILGPLELGANLLSNKPYWLFFPFPMSLSHYPTDNSWVHLPNKLLELKSLLWDRYSVPAAMQKALNISSHLIYTTSNISIL